MKILMQKPPAGGTIHAISSKSCAHRALIAAALSDKPTDIQCDTTNEDIMATVQCLQALGAILQYEDHIFHVSPIRRAVNDSHCTLHCGESGSTLRFMLPVACALGASASFAMEGRLPSRPLSPLYEELIAHGCSLSPQGKSPLITTGQLTGGSFEIAGNISSQFITGLLFALPLLAQDSEIIITGVLESRPYIDITLHMLQQFGIDVQENSFGFYIAGGQQYRSPGFLTVEGDWSNAAGWLALGAISGHSVSVDGLSGDSSQGDKAFIGILKDFGASVTENSGTYTVQSEKLHGVKTDVNAIPDLVPMIALVASVADGTTVIRNAARLRLKESDRLQTITSTLSALGASITETDDGLEIHGVSKLRGGTVSSAGDHRIAMMAAIASSVCEHDVIIDNAESVNKSYPGFYDDWRILDGKIAEVL